MSNVDPHEVAKFDELATRWWDPESEFKPLHEINPLRAGYIEGRCGGVAGKRILDVGCGGGLMAEAMAQRGADVLGIDLSEVAIQVATAHAEQSGLKNVHYRLTGIEALEAEHDGQYDIINCLEMLEHVPDPAAIIEQCYRLLKPGGQLFISTINRNPKSFLFAIVGAEYVLSLVPRGTHEFKKFIRPSELSAWCREFGFTLLDEMGLTYNPITKAYKLTPEDVSVNYMIHVCKDA